MHNNQNQETLQSSTLSESEFGNTLIFSATSDNWETNIKPADQKLKGVKLKFIISHLLVVSLGMF